MNTDANTNTNTSTSTKYEYEQEHAYEFDQTKTRKGIRNETQKGTRTKIITTTRNLTQIRIREGAKATNKKKPESEYDD